MLIPLRLPRLPSRLLTVAGVGTLALAGILGLLVFSAEQAPVSRKYAARSALQAARDSGAGQLAMATLKVAEDAYASAEKEMRIQSSRFFWNRSFGLSEARFDASIRRARLAQESARIQQDRSRDRARQLMERANAGFDQMEWAFGYLPPRSAIRADVRRAQVSYTEAATLLRKADYLPALEAARRANQGLEAAYTRFARFIQGSADPEREARYGRWVRDTISRSASSNGPAIIVDKLRRTLSLVVNGRRERTYRAELGINGTLDKVVAGDRATPEGLYRITEKRGPRQTRWYKALLLNYPNDDDLERFRKAQRRGQISRRSRPGGLIEIHGEGGRGGDWTDGCVALVNRDMDDLFDRVGVGTPVTIVGFETEETVGRAGAVSRTASRAASRRSGGSRGVAGAGGFR